MSVQLSGLNAVMEVPSASGFGFAIVQTQDISYSRALTLVVEATVDGGSTWFVIPATAIGHGSQVTQIWTNGRWFVETYSFDSIRVRITEYTAGSVSVDIAPGSGLSGRMPVDTGASITLGGQTQLATTDTQLRRFAEVESLQSARDDLKDQRWQTEHRGYEVR